MKPVHVVLIKIDSSPFAVCAFSTRDSASDFCTIMEVGRGWGGVISSVGYHNLYLNVHEPRDSADASGKSRVTERDSTALTTRM